MTIPDLDLELIHQGKVRKLYELNDKDTMLMVATDQISAYDWILPTQIDDKGKILTQLSLWWFEQLQDLVPNHVVSAQVPEAVAQRGLVVKKLRMIPVECVARGYLTGSGWAEYQQTQSVCGVALPAGLQDGSRLDQPIFTPATKAEIGEHDENVDFEAMCAHIPPELGGAETGAKLRDLTLQIYARAEQIAREHGIILADTKFEFGLDENDEIVLADEVLTPDSSRFWDAAQYEVGKPIPSFDKQFVRDWLTQKSGWDKNSGTEPPSLPPEIVASTRARYVEAFERLTGQKFDSTQPDRKTHMSRVIVDVMPKPEILDPQGKAVTGALERLGYQGLTVRQGKRFEIEVEGEVTPERLSEIDTTASTLLANTVIETYVVREDK